MFRVESLAIPFVPPFRGDSLKPSLPGIGAFTFLGKLNPEPYTLTRRGAGPLRVRV